MRSASGALSDPQGWEKNWGEGQKGLPRRSYGVNKWARLYVERLRTPCLDGAVRAAGTATQPLCSCLSLAAARIMKRESEESGCPPGRSRGRSDGLPASTQGPRGLVELVWDVRTEEVRAVVTKAGAPGAGRVPLSVCAVRVNLVIPILSGDVCFISPVLQMGAGAVSWNILKKTG